MPKFTYKSVYLYTLFRMYEFNTGDSISLLLSEQELQSFTNWIKENYPQFYEDDIKVADLLDGVVSEHIIKTAVSDKVFDLQCLREEELKSVYSCVFLGLLCLFICKLNLYDQFIISIHPISKEESEIISRELTLLQRFFVFEEEAIPQVKEIKSF